MSEVISRNPEFHRTLHCAGNLDLLTKPFVAEPLFFEPGLRRRLWGGRQLEAIGKDLGDCDLYGESWEISAHPSHVSQVSEGRYEGIFLTQLWEHFASQISNGQCENSRFPFLLKFLDCEQPVSVQVHPDDTTAQRLLGEPNGKSECWLVLDASINARVYAGIKSGVTEEQFRESIICGTTQDLLNSFTPVPGDFINIPAGIVHSVGGGVLLLEVQQPSDATFRIYDWDRIDNEGLPRELHIDNAIESIDWNSPEIIPKRSPSSPVQGELLLDSENFEIRRHHFSGTYRLELQATFQILSVINGGGILTNTDESFEYKLERGSVVLLPSTHETWQIHGSEQSMCEVVTVSPGCKLMNCDNSTSDNDCK